MEALAPHFERVRGVDISEPLLEIARTQRALPNIEYAYGNAETFEGIAHPSESDGYDLIVSHTMLHHLRDPAAAAARLATLLAPEGRLLLVDNVSWTDALPRIVFHIGAWRRWPGSLRAYGWKNAARLHRFSLSKDWLDHLTSDRYLTEAGFRAQYGAVLPGAVMTKMSVFMRVDWQAPTCASRRDSQRLR